MHSRYISFLLAIAILAVSMPLPSTSYAQSGFAENGGIGGLINVIGETIVGGTGLGIIAAGGAFLGGAAITLPLVGVAVIGGSLVYVGANYFCSAYCGQNNFIADHAKKYVDTINRDYFQIPPKAEPINPDLFVDAGPELVLTPEEKAELRDVPASPNTPSDSLEEVKKLTEEALRQLEEDQRRREEAWLNRDPVSPPPQGVKDALGGLDPKKVTYEEALAKARNIGDGIVAQIISQVEDPVAKQISNAAAPKIEELFARSFSDGTFYSYDQGTLKTLIYNQIKPEVDRFLTDPNSRQVGYGIADQIASQMAEQFIANPLLDSVELTLTVDKPLEVTDEEVNRIINELRILQSSGPKYGFVIWKGIAAGLWIGDMRFNSQDCGLPREAGWLGSWVEGEQINIHTTGTGERRYYSLLGDMTLLSASGASPLSGLHYVGSNDVLLFADSKSGHELTLTGKISSLSGDELFDKSMTGTLQAICPSDRSKVVEGTFDGKRYKSDVTGLWNGSFDITAPAACAEESSWQVRFTEIKQNDPNKIYSQQTGDLTGMFERGSERLEARGVYMPGTAEVIWVAGDYAFVGKVSGGGMSGTMLGRDCEAEGEYPEGRHRRGAFQASFVER